MLDILWLYYASTMLTLCIYCTTAACFFITPAVATSRREGEQSRPIAEWEELAEFDEILLFVVDISMISYDS